MPVLLLLAIALTAALVGGFAVWRFPRPTTSFTTATLDKAREVGVEAKRHPGLRAFLGARLDPATATGLLLTLAMLVAIGGGVLLAALAYLTRTNSDLTAIDNGVAKWGNRHATTTSMHVINGITQLGGIYTVVVLCLVLAVAITIRERSKWIAPFIALVMGGDELLTGTVKQLADRLRPTFNPAAATLGPSFPSGHSATAAAFYATAALLIGRRSSPAIRAVLAGLAIGIAVAVAASRVLLDLHWLTDVIAGLGLGWAWFAVCAIAFGGRILRFGATAETAAKAAGARNRSSLA
jgi:membrane-associated phospholipid phosphatase